MPVSAAGALSSTAVTLERRHSSLFPRLGQSPALRAQLPSWVSLSPDWHYLGVLPTGLKIGSLATSERPGCAEASPRTLQSSTHRDIFC